MSQLTDTEQLSSQLSLFLESGQPFCIYFLPAIRCVYTRYILCKAVALNEKSGLRSLSPRDRAALRRAWDRAPARLGHRADGVARRREPHEDTSMFQGPCGSWATVLPSCWTVDAAQLQPPHATHTRRRLDTRGL